MSYRGINSVGSQDTEAHLVASKSGSRNAPNRKVDHSRPRCDSTRGKMWNWFLVCTGEITERLCFAVNFGMLPLDVKVPSDWVLRREVM